MASKNPGLGGRIPTVMKGVSASQLKIDSTMKLGKGVSNVERYGQSQTFPPPWTEGEERLVLDLNGLNEGDPYTQAVILSAKLPFEDTGFYFAQWVIEAGAGGGRTTFYIDAGGVQQITLPAESLRLSIRCVAPFTGSRPPQPLSGYQSPTGSIVALAYCADGTTATAAPTLTQRFDCGVGQTITVVAPPGATSFRIAGNFQAAVSPYVATARYDIHGPNSLVLDRYLGDFLLPIRWEMLPFSGQASLIQITSSGPAITGYIVWGIDL